MYVSLPSMTEDVVLREHTYLLKILLAASKKAITMRWDRTEPPSLEVWRLLTHKMRTKEEQYRDNWDKWNMFNKSTTGTYRRRAHERCIRIHLVIERTGSLPGSCTDKV